MLYVLFYILVESINKPMPKTRQPKIDKLFSDKNCYIFAVAYPPITPF